MWSRTARRARGAGLGLTTCAVALVLATPSHLAADAPPPRAGVASEQNAPEPAAALPSPGPAAPSREPAAPSPEPSSEATPDGVPEPVGQPVRVVIPAIGVDAPLVRLGLVADGSMQVPGRGLAGWYVEGPRPGHDGPAVIAAHVDSHRGPDVFHRLRELAPGDQVHVLYDSGDEVTFVVASSARTPKDALPVADIWPLTSDRLLTLITCGGEFDRSVRRYRDNVIVYTSPLEPTPERPRPAT